MESSGVLFPKKQTMRIHSSLWNADDWATRGGRVKTDWRQAPFTASFRKFDADEACVWVAGSSSCGGVNSTWIREKLGAAGLKRMRWVQKSYMIYNYCTDTKRFPKGLPPECSLTTASI